MTDLITYLTTTDPISIDTLVTLIFVWIICVIVMSIVLYFMKEYFNMLKAKHDAESESDEE